MTELATHLVDRVIRDVPVPQWVLSRPWSLRYQLAFDAALCRNVLAVFIRVVFGWLRRRGIAALLNPAEGHRPSRVLDFAPRGRDRGLRRRGKEERLAAARGLWNSDALIFAASAVVEKYKYRYTIIC